MNFCQCGLSPTIYKSDFQQYERILRPPHCGQIGLIIIRQFINSLKVIINDLIMPMSPHGVQLQNFNKVKMVEIGK